MWGATTVVAAHSGKCGFQSTRPVWGATGDVHVRGLGQSISIHAPRVGRDAIALTSYSKAKTNFNPRAPCGARPTRKHGYRMVHDFNPRAPCGARPTRRGTSTSDQDFNPRAPCGARHGCNRGRRNHGNFNPRAPCGARRGEDGAAVYVCRFQSTRPVWGATSRNSLSGCSTSRFQSTRPVWGATGRRLPRPSCCRNFNPRAPCGARRCHVAPPLDVDRISIHAPRVGRDCKGEFTGCPFYDFNPRAPCGARRALAVQRLAVKAISIHAPRVGRDPPIFR